MLRAGRERWLDLVDEVSADVEVGSSETAEELASGGGEHVAADAVDVHGQLHDRLAGVWQIRDAGLLGRGSDLFGWFTRPP